MSIFTLIMIVLTAVAIVFGILWGMKRGFNHSFLRLLLIIGCAVGAIFLHQPLADVICGIEIGDQKLVEMFIGDVATEQELLFNLAIVQFLVKIISYLIVFGLLRLLSWLTIFPILKIFIKKDLKKHTWWGALVGLIQGVVIAIIVLAPLNSLASELTVVATAPVENNIAVDLVKDLDLTKHIESPISEIFNNIGDWYYDIIAKQK